MKINKKQNNVLAAVTIFAVRASNALIDGIGMFQARLEHSRRGIVIAAVVSTVVVFAIAAMPRSLGIISEPSTTFKEVVADRSKPIAFHSYRHTAKTVFVATRTGFAKNMYWFSCSSRERGTTEVVSRKVGGFLLGYDFEDDLDGTYVISDHEYHEFDELCEGSYVYLGKMVVKCGFFWDSSWEYPVYMDERLPNSEKKRLISDFKKDTIKNIQDSADNEKGAAIVHTETGAIIDKFLEPKVVIDFL